LHVADVCNIQLLTVDVSQFGFFRFLVLVVFLLSCLRHFLLKIGIQIHSYIE
jgi:hypothetical protein